MICLSRESLIEKLEDIGADLMSGHEVIAAHRLGIILGLLYAQNDDEESDGQKD